MRKIVLLVGLLVTMVIFRVAAQGDYLDHHDRDYYFKRFNALNSAILKGGVKKDAFVKQFDTLFHAMYTFDAMKSTIIIPLYHNQWVFPLKGYKVNAIGGNGDGYSDKGYHFLDGNKHTAHPAHDIFIRDKNQDCMDDYAKKPVDVLAVRGGWVVACSDTWDVNSNLRGGKYIWIYHPKDLSGRPEGLKGGYFTYYAHNSAIFVKPGQEVKPGQKIAEVGRTGYNAYKKRSPTHLHFSAFRLVDDIPVPFNPYQQLKKAKTL
ncbi:M23 family metallopeptidase [Mucilaginibacter sp. OK283]|jgi:murein DD-endopeptidase MepM/ murein hydrolase activator NlpD|uniref:M23 family metallopeptidase n=1 Tax=Mucilaginibacter sp. OK283 TaxID=1881049 RepID=UPI0008C29BE5|nr:M23 family metallopeptidase [Mucilaginibacter sp. OK283]SEP22541.1 Peptidase family M23 [Mucilaginibacter sp. OK283]